MTGSSKNPGIGSLTIIQSLCRGNVLAGKRLVGETTHRGNFRSGKRPDTSNLTGGPA